MNDKPKGKIKTRFSDMEKSGQRTEWVCPHGIGHHRGVHGCDGCCADEPEMSKTTDDRQKLTDEIILGVDIGVCDHSTTAQNDKHITEKEAANLVDANEPSFPAGGSKINIHHGNVSHAGDETCKHCDETRANFRDFEIKAVMEKLDRDHPTPAQDGDKEWWNVQVESLGEIPGRPYIKDVIRGIIREAESRAIERTLAEAREVVVGMKVVGVPNGLSDRYPRSSAYNQACDDIACALEAKNK